MKKYFLQTDKRWLDCIMTCPNDFPEMSLREKKQRWEKLTPDYVWRYGCLITSLATILEITPDVVNEVLRENKGYMGLLLGETCKIGQESFLNWEIATKIFKFEVNYYIEKENIRADGNYIARVPFSPIQGIFSGHYNVIDSIENGNLIHFDTYSGVHRKDWGADKLYWIHEIIRR